MRRLRIQLFEIAMVAALAMNATSVTWANDFLVVKCDWVKSTDLKTLQVESISGSAEFTYEPLSDITGLIRKEGLNETLIAGMKDKFIEGSVYYKENGMPVELHVQINRNTGVVRSVIKANKKDVMLEGKCVRISGPSFGKDPGAE